MGTYLLKRLLAMIPTLLGITLVTFFIIRLAPGDPVATSFGAETQAAGAESEESGGKQRADAVKAKKELLGMMEKDFTIREWDGDVARFVAVTSGDKFARPAELALVGRSTEFVQWARALALSPDGGTLYGRRDDNGTTSRRNWLPSVFCRMLPAVLHVRYRRT